MARACYSLRLAYPKTAGAFTATRHIGAFPPLEFVFRHNDNKPQRESKNSWFFKASVHGRFCSLLSEQIADLKKWFIYKDFEVQNGSYQVLPAVFRHPLHVRLRFLKIAFHSCKSPKLRFNVHQEYTYPRDK